MAKLERWNPDNISAQQGPAMTSGEEFAQAMLSAGLFVGQRPDGDHPIMDSKKHRVPNDLATQSRLGREGIERQVRTTVNKAVAEVKQKQQQRRQQTQRQRHTRQAVNR